MENHEVTKNLKKITIIVPVYNEEEAITPFMDAFYSLNFQKDLQVEIMFVNDGSTDETLNQILHYSESTAYVSVVNFSRNFGKEAAMTAGLDKCVCDAAIIMDVDLQDPIELISDFILHWREGFQVVYGVRAARKSDSWFKRKSAELFYKVFNKLSSVQLPNSVGDFRLMDKAVIDAVKLMPERDRFMKGIFAWVGFRAKAVSFSRSKRSAGRTKFSAKKLFSFAFDGIMSFSTVPLKLSVYFAATMASLTVFYATFLIVRTLIYGIDLPGYASIMVVLLLTSSMQLLCLGILGAYIAKISRETKQRPLYIIKNIKSKRNDVTL